LRKPEVIHCACLVTIISDAIGLTGVVRIYLGINYLCSKFHTHLIQSDGSIIQ